LLLIAQLACGPAPAPPDDPLVGDLMALGYLAYVEADDEERAGVTLWDRSATLPGYVLVVSRNARRADLVDREGSLVHRWFADGVGYWARALLMPNGDLIVVGEDDAGGYVQRLTWTGRSRFLARTPAHHDVAPLGDGRFATLLWKQRRIGTIDRFFDTRDDELAILGPHGQVVERRSIYQMLADAPDVFQIVDVGQWVYGHQVRDPFHANAVEWMDDPELAAREPLFALDHVLVSLRNQDAVVLFDWTEKRALWSWGQGELLGPHDATVLPGGNVMVFDNGVGRGWSRVIELDPRTKRIVWEYRAPEDGSFFTESRGSNVRMANGNTLITESDAARVFEVTAEGQIVWEYVNPSVDGVRPTLVKAEFVPQDVVDDLWRGLECGSDGDEDGGPGLEAEGSRDEALGEDLP
jgi:hypothetical protein